MELFALPSVVGLLIQATGALLMSTLCFVLLRTMRRVPLVYWSVGWASLFVALAMLWVSFQFPASARATRPIYLLGEYLFGFMVFAGCRQYATGVPIDRREPWLIAPAVILAIGLPVVAHFDFDVLFTVHAVVYGYLFLAAFRAVRRARRHPRSLGGIRVVQTALALLCLGYFHYAVLFALVADGKLPSTLPYLVYSPLYDLLLLVALMFGMVMLVAGEVQYELEVANAELGEAHARIEERSRLDHLTSALNRHALHSLISDPPAGSRAIWRGSAAVADIDNLKVINDRYGHAAGDAALRAVAGAIRQCIRADDLLFRWGGDEFLVLLIGVDESEARTRLAGLNDRLRGLTLQGMADPAPVDVSVSVGFAAFDAATSLDNVIALADEAMYGRKRQT